MFHALMILKKAEVKLLSLVIKEKKKQTKDSQQI